MIVAIIIYALAHVGAIAAQPVIINGLAIGTIVESSIYYNVNAQKESIQSCQKF